MLAEKEERKRKALENKKESRRLHTSNKRKSKKGSHGKNKVAHDDGSGSGGNRGIDAQDSSLPQDSSLYDSSRESGRDSALSSYGGAISNQYSAGMGANLRRELDKKVYIAMWKKKAEEIYMSRAKVRFYERTSERTNERANDRANKRANERASEARGSPSFCYCFLRCFARSSPSSIIR